MRSVLAISALAALTFAAPTPQDIDFDLAIALANPSYSIEVGVTAQTVTYDAASIVSAVVAQVTSESVVETDVAKRVKRTACQPQPSGASSAPTVSPDSPAAFASNTAFGSVASAAPLPAGYSNTFTNLNASNK